MEPAVANMSSAESPGDNSNVANATVDIDRSHQVRQAVQDSTTEEVEAKQAQAEAEPQPEDAQEAQAQAPAMYQQVSWSELLKWNEMIDFGIEEYMRAHPDRFHRRVRRGIPPRFRWQVWKAAVGLQNIDVPDNTTYEALATAKNKWTEQIEIDISRTFPDNKSFDSPKQQRLLRVLNAYAGHSPDVGYCQGMNFVAGLLLLVSEDEIESFRVMICLMDHKGISGFYRERLPLLRRYLKACDKLVQETVPELREHFIKENVQAAVYLHQWFLTLFINCFPLSMVLIIWDVIICEGLSVVLRIAVSILQVLKDSLLSMHFEEIIKFFKMMKTYDDEDGELNAFRIGQLLMKHTELVQIPEQIMQYLNRPLDDEDQAESDESWEGNMMEGSWLQGVMRMLTPWSTKRRPGGSQGSQQRGSDGSPSGPAPPAMARASTPNSADAASSEAGGPGSAGISVTARVASSLQEQGPIFGSVGSEMNVTESAPMEDESVTRGWEFL
mmetsp:Transcript_65691/g.109001  ORF Transcript_65691/g.109001 Transcript_65691/m.109001 type:complete len:498 (+) Transcript_65691:243-1736(+)